MAGFLPSCHLRHHQHGAAADTRALLRRVVGDGGRHRGGTPGPGEPPEAAWAQLRAPHGPTLNFEYERHFERPVWPSVPGRRSATQHLDVHVTDTAAAVEHAVSCGAAVADEQPQENVTVLFDPDGHPFCLFEG